MSTANFAGLAMVAIVSATVTSEAHARATIQEPAAVVFTIPMRS